MRIDELRTTLHDLADEAEDVPLAERLRGIDAHARRDRRRRRMAGATAAVVALALVGVGLSVTDNWRTNSSDPVERPDKDDLRTRTLIDQGVAIQVNPGNARLGTHQVGTAEDGQLDFSFTPSGLAIAYDVMCIAPSSSPYVNSNDRYTVRIMINGAFGRVHHRGCFTSPPPMTAIGWPDSGRLALQPGKSADVRVVLVDQHTGEPVADPSIRLAGAVYDARGPSAIDLGTRVEPDLGPAYQLVDFRVGEADRPISLEIDTSDAQARYTYDWSGGWVGARGSIAAWLIRRDGSSERKPGFASEYDGHDGETIRLVPSPEVDVGTLVIAVYEHVD